MIYLTRQLGIQYLWIDALCIIQGDADDWAIKGGQMADIYGNSAITIAARDAGNSSEGFLRRESCVQDKVSVRGINVLLIPEPSAWYLDPLRGDPLADRGWIFQERLLSRRVLYFGKYKTSWECETYERYENLHCASVPGDVTRGGSET